MLALLATGRIEEARAEMERANGALEASPDAFEEGEASIRRAHVEVLAREGRAAEAAAAAEAALRRIEARAAKIGDAELRASFVERVPDHAALAAGARGAPR